MFEFYYFLFLLLTVASLPTVKLFYRKKLLHNKTNINNLSKVSLKSLLELATLDSSLHC